MKIVTCGDDIGSWYSLFMMVIICGMCFFRVLKAGLGDLFQFM